MNEGPGLDLGRPRDLSELLSDAFRVLRDHPGTFILMAAAVVVPVHLVVSGIGLEQITAPYDDKPGTAETVIPTVVSFFVVAPLITATVIHALSEVAAGERPRPGPAIQAGLDAFTPLFLAILIAAAGIALGLAALILPGIYLLVRWFFVPQTVVVEGKRGFDALARSGKLVEGSWWRAFGVVLVAQVIAAVPAILIIEPMRAVAESADREVVRLIGTMAIECLTTPFVALVATFLYYDMRARREGRYA